MSVVIFHYSHKHGTKGDQHCADNIHFKVYSKAFEIFFDKPIKADDKNDSDDDLPKGLGQHL